MNKQLLVLFFVLSALLGYSQLEPAEIVLNNGKKLSVLAKIKGDYIKYKTHKEAKREEIHFSTISSFEILAGKEKKTYKWVKVKDKNYRVLEEVCTGRVSMYLSTAIGYSPTPSPGMGGFRGVSNSYTIENYYLKRTTETEAEHLGSNQWFTKNFKDAASAYFSDCPELVEKIKNKEYKKRDLVEIVEYYNNECY